MNVYIAGPMRGRKLYNFPEFFRAAEILERLGMRPVNPAEMDTDVGFDPAKLPEDHDWSTFHGINNSPLASIVRRDLNALTFCDAILLLPEWETSKGARAEHATAEWLGLKVFKIITQRGTTTRILEIDRELGLIWEIQESVTGFNLLSPTLLPNNSSASTKSVD